jgi:hypothetical protein
VVIAPHKNSPYKILPSMLATAIFPNSLIDLVRGSVAQLVAHLPTNRKILDLNHGGGVVVSEMKIHKLGCGSLKHDPVKFSIRCYRMHPLSMVCTPTWQ